jgi:hypothetical protein
LTEKEGGGWTVALGFTNLTDDQIALAARPTAEDGGCEPKLDEPNLPKAEHSDVTVRIPAGCKVADDGIDLELVATPARGEPVTFPVTAAPKPKPDTDPDWEQLQVFPILLIVGLICLGVAALLTRVSPFNGLPYLESTWSFKDSWASNITVAGGLLTGLLGSSDVLDPVFGDDAKPALALATVGAAVAVALAGAGALAALALRKKADGGARDVFTPFGLVIAGAITVAAAGGELWVVLKAGDELDLGWFGDRLPLATYVLGALLALYAIRSIAATIRAGSTPPPQAPPSDAILSAVLVLEGLRGVPGVEPGVIDAYAKYYPTIVPHRGAPRAPSQAAITEEAERTTEAPVILRYVTPPARRGALL